MTFSRWEPDVQGNEISSAQYPAGVTGRISACSALLPLAATQPLRRDFRLPSSIPTSLCEPEVHRLQILKYIFFPNDPNIPKYLQKTGQRAEGMTALYEPAQSQCRVCFFGPSLFCSETLY